MKIVILTLFPQMIRDACNVSILKRAQEKRLAELTYINIRDFAGDRYKTVDDHPYGGGTGMILRVDIVDKAINEAKKQVEGKGKVLLLDPQGKTYSQKKAGTLAALDYLILVCGHYEGVDERIRNLVDEELSIGDYVLTGGELPALVVVDSVVRLLPGVLQKDDATLKESFDPQTSLLEYPQYTRPPEYNRLKVPEILLSGDHRKIDQWRQDQAKQKTKKRRPDLLKNS